jgi:pilus assembly protein CpaB
MAQPIPSSAVGGRVNRRFLLLAAILAALSAVLMYAAWPSDSGGGTSSAVEVPVVVARAAIPAGTEITVDMVEVVNVSEGAVGEDALTSTEAVIGRTARYPISANQPILLKDIVTSGVAVTNDVLQNILEGGQRGMAIDVEAVVGAGGLVLPGDHVDVYWIPENPVDDVPGAQLIAEDVEVVAVAQTLVEIAPTAPGLQDEGAVPAGSPEDRVRGSDAAPEPKAITVTLMLTPEQASRVFCGDEGGVLRLAVRAFGDRSPNGLPIVDCIIIGSSSQQ